MILYGDTFCCNAIYRVAQVLHLRFGAPSCCWIWRPSAKHRFETRRYFRLILRWRLSPQSSASVSVSASVGYADLSDFFYVWLRRTLSDVHPDLFRRVLAPKNEELVATPRRHGGKDEADKHFMEGMKQALHGFASSMDGVPAAIYYAYKQQEAEEDALTSPGWSSFLQAAVDSGLAIDGTWPVRSESEGRSRALGSNALASSIVLVCRRRCISAPIITRADFLRALRREMPAALAEFRRASVGPTDIQAGRHRPRHRHLHPSRECAQHRRYANARQRSAEADQSSARRDYISRRRRIRQRDPLRARLVCGQGI
jgi:adenine-specific DNA methylase